MKRIELEALTVQLRLNAIVKKKTNCPDVAKYLWDIADYIESCLRSDVGRWIETREPAEGLPGLYQEKHHCSVCGYERYGSLKYSTNFCGNCGKLMVNGGKKEVAEAVGNGNG